MHGSYKTEKGKRKHKPEPPRNRWSQMEMVETKRGYTRIKIGQMRMYKKAD